jgi:hypothetical protein
VAEAGEREGVHEEARGRAAVFGGRDVSSIADAMVGTGMNRVERSRSARGNHGNRRESHAESRFGERHWCAKPNERKNRNGDDTTLPSGLARLLKVVIRA